MRCSDARPALSALLDDELAPKQAVAVRTHRESCAPCRRYDSQIRRLRTQLRIEPLESVVDVEPAVRARLDESGHRAPTRNRRVRLVSLAAAFVASFIVGASVVGLGTGPEPVGARDLSGGVLRAQRAIESLTADVSIVERGWHADVPERSFTGTIAYDSPESLVVTLHDKTVYPSGEWVPNDSQLVVADEYSWERGVVRCPRDALPGCTPRAPRTRALLGREPFPDVAAAPLDLVVPVGSFARSGRVEDLGENAVDGRDAIGVRVTVAQVKPLLDGLLTLGNARPLHPTDRVDLWLDRDALVPLALDVRAAPSEERAEWAARGGLDDGDDVLVAVRWTNVAVDDVIPEGVFPPPPAEAIVRDAGFRAEPDVALPTPAWLPPGMSEVRAGSVHAGGPAVGARAWSDGRAWVKVATTAEWVGGRLFGDMGDVVRRIDDRSAGIVYVDERGERVAVHADGVDAVVVGSVATEDLVHVATSLGLTGRTVPDDWNEAATVDIADLSAADWLLPADTSGVVARADADTLTLAYAGAGARGYVVVQAPGERLGPPFDPAARAVEVRNVVARWSPTLGTLEWVEGGKIIAVTSATMSLGELAATAEGMR